ncbi:leucyl aminopeptidase [Alkalisalibacterium limincola]|uniref:Probable cytosol aminopeptidase n=1 Tax=Alkalisalibacterium limincola TaxID=2699169 RepID=A0A5C8KU56_9GAMM|nr:leucyl aminopeptidase [Alkalisalibacterium limincola]TXK64986.1 leucyl aminopeptidase [Alkalisalibacterium limincola]
MPLEFDLNQSSPAQASHDLVIVGAYADKSLTPSARAIDEASEGRLAALLEGGDLSGKIGKTGLLHGLPGVKSARVLVVGLGEAAKFDAGAFRKAVIESVKVAGQTAATSALLTLGEVAVKGQDAAWSITQAVVAADHASYRYTATRSDKNNGSKLAQVSVLGETSHQAALDDGIGIALGVAFARELGNLPPNICNPTFLGEEGQRLAAENPSVSCEVLEREDMEKLGMGALLAVSRGSANPPKIVVLSYTGAGDAKPYVLVGKGITFDSGGINLKVAGGVEEMKFDMCGAATVMGAFLATVKRKLPINLVTVVAAVENMCDGDAYRPSDVITSMSGKTIEVLNTDAEGRLILCDALTYAQKFEPKAIVDVATLTGACVVALGQHASGLMSKHDDLADELLAAGEQVFDRAWRLPLWDEYQPMLDSGFADMANIGGRWAGTVTAGCFLSRFTEGQRWAHLDIAGSAWEMGRKGLATGRPVGLLSQWLGERAK